MSEHQPHDGPCCECVPRLRQQNKASSDKWTRRTRDLVRDLQGLRGLMVRATDVNDTALGLSVYGQSALAAALKAAEESRQEAEAWREQARRDRSALRMHEDSIRREVIKRSRDKVNQTLVALETGDWND